MTGLVGGVAGRIVSNAAYTAAGESSYMDSYRLVSEQGVEAWVRASAGNRLDPATSNPAHSEWYIREMCRTQKHVVQEAFKCLVNVDLSSVLQQIRVPAMIVVGEHSPTNIPDRAENMVALLPQGRLKVVPGATGFVQHTAPEQCAALWREFVADLGHPGQQHAG